MAEKPHAALDGALDLQSLIAARLAPLRGKCVLVVGDLMLDHYLWGEVERTSPQAPVPVLRHEREGWALGGAANVARNVADLGGKALLVGVVGADETGRRLRQALKDNHIPVTGILTDESRPSTLKTRMVSRGQELLRVDVEDKAPLAPAVEKKLIERLRRLLPRAGAVVLSDYAKGVLGPRIIELCRRETRRRNVPLLADPKGRGYERYRGVDLLTPNQRELALETGREVAAEDDLLSAARSVIRKARLAALIVTRGPEGVSVLRPRRRMHHIPARAREVFDDTGAGDSLIATLALGLAADMPLEDAAAIANHAGGIVVGKLGVATVLPGELLAALEGGRSTSKLRSLADLKIVVANQQTTGRKVVFTNGCFDLLHPGHISFLQEARRQGDLLIVGLNSDRSVRAVKGPPRPILGEDERAAILSALEVVDYLLFYDELTPRPLLEALRPDVLVKGSNIAPEDVVGRDFVESYGGRVCRLPVLHPAKTPELIESIAGKSRKTKKPHKA